MTKHRAPRPIDLPAPDPAPWEAGAPPPPGMKACVVCGQPFRPRTRRMRFCSPACRQKAYRGRQQARGTDR